jgi:hypothetical protein
MKLDRWAIGLAIALELVLMVLAAFGGPHGALGGWPWLLQLPGILLVLGIPGDALFLWRVVAAALVQASLWYLVIAWIRRRRRATAA